VRVLLSAGIFALAETNYHHRKTRDAHIGLDYSFTQVCGQKIFNTLRPTTLCLAFGPSRTIDKRGKNMTQAENKMDPFNIGLYAIEAGLVGVVIYAMAVLPALFKPMI
jgi:hypothetical protein